MQKTKVCIKCNLEKPATVEYFPPREISGDGLRSDCRTCKNKYSRKWKAANKERLDERYGEQRKEYLKNYNQVNNEKLKQQKREHYKKHAEHFNFLGRERYWENREQENTRRKESYTKNRERELNNKKDYYLKNKSRINAYNKTYAEKNKDKLGEYYKSYYWKNRNKKLSYNKLYQQEYRINNRDKINRWTHQYRAKKKALPIGFAETDWEECKQHFNNACAYCGREKPLEQEHFVPVSKNGGYTRANMLPSCRECNMSKNTHAFKNWYPSYRHYCKDREYKILNYFFKIRGGENGDKSNSP